MYFISGVSGVGKTSLVPFLKSHLGADAFDVRDFDERGVPDGGGQAWHDAETRHWLDTALRNAEDGKSTIVCGFSLPEIVRRVSTGGNLPWYIFFLDASAGVIRKRLLSRHSTHQSKEEIERAGGLPLERFIEKMIADAPVVRALCEKEGCTIIDTDNETPESVAKEVIARILP